MHEGTGEADDPVGIVRDGYNRVSWAYQDDAGSIDPGIRLDAVRDLGNRLQRGGRVVDLGCGNGVPVARELSRLGFDVVVVDVSPVQVEWARSLVPEASFLCADMTSVELSRASFDAVIAFWSIIHVPIDQQPVLLDQIVNWLTPGAWFMATVGWHAWTGVEHDWLGVPGGTMYWSHTDWPTFREWLTSRGFAIERDCFIPEGEGGHQFVLAQLDRRSPDAGDRHRRHGPRERAR